MSATADLTAYRAWLQNRERSPGTIAKYLRDTARFFAESGAPQIPPKAAVAAWRDALAARGYAPASVNAMLAAVNACQDFLWNRKKSLEAGGPVGSLQHRDDAHLYYGIRRRAPETAGTHASFAVKKQKHGFVARCGAAALHNGISLLHKRGNFYCMVAQRAQKIKRLCIVSAFSAKLDKIR